MIIEKKKRFVVLLGWLLVFTLGHYLAYVISPPQDSLFSLDFLLFILLLIPCALLPLVIENVTISVTIWITLVVFLKYGLFAEMVISQIFVIIVMLKRKLNSEQHTRFLINSIMFVLVSLFSGLTYYALGGTHEAYTLNDPYFWVITAIYCLVHSVLNQGMLLIGYYYYFNKKLPILSQDTKWEFLSILIVFPIGNILYFLHNTVGLIAFLLVGIPVVMILFILRFYYSTKEINKHLQRVVEFSHLLTARLHGKEALQLFVENLTKMFAIDFVYIFEKTGNEHLRLIRSYELGSYVDKDIPLIEKNKGIAGMAWGQGKALLFSERSEWEELVYTYLPEHVESIIVVPMIKNEETTGMIFVASTKKKAFEKYHLMIMEILCSYLAIALDNARHYEKTKQQSERDPLTNLYNARVITEKIEEGFEQLNSGQLEKLALLMVDIDHFKSVNDTYGHESGNIVLQQVSELLKKMVGDKGILGRYGGEEFTILLPDYDKDLALDFAELIRQTIEDHVFVLYDDLAEVRRKINVRLTVSIGVAIAPDDTDEVTSFIRVADRTLYLGAKQVGRNRVAEYKN